MSEARKCHCGKTLLKRQKKTCSRECQYELLRHRAKGKNEIEVKCAFCNVLFSRKAYKIRSSSANLYCSLACCDEHKRTLRSGSGNGMFGMKHSDERNAHMSKLMKEKWANDDEYRAKHAERGFGSSYALARAHSDEACEKRQRTMLEKYGVDHSFKSDANRRSCNSKSAHEKRHVTMKKNGTYAKSSAEDAFYSSLCRKFGEFDVHRQVTMNGWKIDFYVHSLKTYIQFDGVYWHGLDRPVEMINASKNPRDKVILETMQRDREQNHWFSARGKRLVRITDKEFVSMTNDELWSLLNG